jgi:hypothetical protein
MGATGCGELSTQPEKGSRRRTREGISFVGAGGVDGEINGDAGALVGGVFGDDTGV